MTIITFSIVAITVLISAFVQGSTGMGFAMVAAPVVSIIDPSLIPVMLLVLMIPLNFYIAARERSEIHWYGVKWISVGRFAGTFFGLWILVIVNLHQLALLIGWSTLVAAVIALLAPKFTPNKPVLAIVGLITGVTETSTGVGGPPYALAYQHSPGPELRSTVAVCFLVGEVISSSSSRSAVRYMGRRCCSPRPCCPFWPSVRFSASTSTIDSMDRCCAISSSASQSSRAPSLSSRHERWSVGRSRA